MFPQRREEFDRFALEALIEQPGAKRPVHRHGRAHAFMVFAGVVYDETDDETRVIRPGELLVRPAGVVHENHYGAEGASLIWIDMARGLAETFAPLYGDRWAGPPLTFSMLRQMPQLILGELASPDAVSRKILPGMVEQLLGIGARAAAWNDRPGWLRRAIQFLEVRSAEKFSIAEAAREVGVSPSRLAHGFRKHLGRTVGDYLRDLRIGHAERALAEGDQSIATVAAACGFADQAHLARTFRARRGMTPSEYRRMNRHAAQR